MTVGAYLELNLEQRRKIDQRNFHPFLLPVHLYCVVEVTREAVVKVKPFVSDVDV